MTDENSRRIVFKVNVVNMADAKFTVQSKFF